MAGTNCGLYWFTFQNGWNTDGSSIIITKPSKGLNIRDAQDRLRRGYPKMTLAGQATQEEIAEYQALKS